MQKKAALFRAQSGSILLSQAHLHPALIHALIQALIQAPLLHSSLHSTRGLPSRRPSGHAYDVSEFACHILVVRLESPPPYL
mmetsp:Transcript_10911/g.33642  ORF Transcript_10911/g.33642 Transcript_10911/m.33642 type:complete len:82 (+) Transcript_10911:157-402(+)